MIFKITTEKSLYALKDTNKKILIYGAGMIGQVVMPYIIQHYNLEMQTIAFLDADVTKQGGFIHIGDRKYPIDSPNKLNRYCDQNIVIFVTNSNYKAIFDMFNTKPELKDTEVYLIPMLMVERAKKHQAVYCLNKTKEQCIPKHIHYCWLSKREKPDAIKYCIDSWHKFCPDYEFTEWNEDNYNFFSNDYMREAYEAGKYGFVPDVARLEILLKYGGIYLDTDVELIKSLDDLLFQKAFVSVEKWGSINFGGGSGSIPGLPVIQEILNFRKDEHFMKENGQQNKTTCGYYETTPLLKRGMKPNNTLQEIADLTILTSDFFQPYDYMSGETSITINTHGIHHFTSNWLDDEDRELRYESLLEYRKLLGASEALDD